MGFVPYLHHMVLHRAVIVSQKFLFHIIYSVKRAQLSQVQHLQHRIAVLNELNFMSLPVLVAALEGQRLCALVMFTSDKTRFSPGRKAAGN